MVIDYISGKKNLSVCITRLLDRHSRPTGVKRRPEHSTTRPEVSREERSLVFLIVNEINDIWRFLIGFLRQNNFGHVLKKSFSFTAGMLDSWNRSYFTKMTQVPPAPH